MAPLAFKNELYDTLSQQLEDPEIVPTKVANVLHAFIEQRQAELAQECSQPATASFATPAKNPVRRNIVKMPASLHDSKLDLLMFWLCPREVEFKVPTEVTDSPFRNALLDYAREKHQLGAYVAMVHKLQRRRRDIRESFKGVPGFRRVFSVTTRVSRNSPR